MSAAGSRKLPWSWVPATRRRVPHSRIASGSGRLFLSLVTLLALTGDSGAASRGAEISVLEE